MNVSEVKQEILDLLILNGRAPQTIKSEERVVYLYDALNIVNKEFSKIDQPQLNENQKIVLDWLKENKMDNLFLTTARLHRGFLSGGVSSQVKSACGALDLQQQAQVLQVFASWVEQEEE